MNDQATLFYVHDPMCSWCWGFRPTWDEVESALIEHLPIRYLLGGLAPDSNQPMPLALQKSIQSHWRTIQARIPGTEFNFDFWHVAQPRRSTYPACRAVIAARRIDPNLEKPMIKAIQQGYYLQARNPSDESVLADFATDIGLGRDQFLSELRQPETALQLQQEIQWARLMGVSSFPGLVLKLGQGIHVIKIDYLDPSRVVKPVQRLLELR